MYIPAAELKAAGLDPHDPRPFFYRVWGSPAGRGGLLLRFYREP